MFKKDVTKYESTRGCIACTEATMTRGSEPRGALRITPRSGVCRVRMAELMRDDAIDKTRVQKPKESMEKFEGVAFSCKKTMRQNP